MRATSAIYVSATAILVLRTHALPCPIGCSGAVLAPALVVASLPAGHVMNRLSSLVIAALVTVGVAVVVAATGTAQQPGEQTVKLVERPLTGHLVDNPPRATRRGSPLFSAGDLTVQTSALFDESNTTRLGTLHSECIATHGGTREGRATFHCNGTFKLERRTLAFDFAGRPAETITLAITGGTGAFEGRDGSDLATENGDVVEHTIRLGQ